MEEDPATLEKRAWRKQMSGHLWPGHTEEAVDLFITAGNLYKLREQPLQAANCYMSAVHLLKSGPDVEDYSMEAGKLYFELSSWENCLKAYRCGIDESIKSRSRKAAWALKDMAAAYRHIGQVEQAKDALEQASALFFSTKQTLQGTKCLLEIAEVVARRAKHPPTFLEAAVAYDHAFAVMTSHKMQVSPDMMLRRGFCRALANATADAQADPDPFLDRMMFAIRANDEELFTEMLYQWDKKNRMSDTSLQLSLRIKHQFEVNELL